MVVESPDGNGIYSLRRPIRFDASIIFRAASTAGLSRTRTGNALLLQLEERHFDVECGEDVDNWEAAFSGSRAVQGLRSIFARY
jgi:hypothetical protein